MHSNQLACLLVVVGIAGCGQSGTPAPAPIKASADVHAAFEGAKRGDVRGIAGGRFCWCPPGRFVMGSPPDEPERRYDHIGFRVVALRP